MAFENLLYASAGRTTVPCLPAMFSLLNNCCTWIKDIKEPIRGVTLLMVGLDGAGKTSIVQGLQKVSACDVTPTVEFTRTDLQIDRFEVTLYDLGGGQRYRHLWKDYYPEAHGIIFVLDSSDLVRIGEVRHVLAEVLKHPKVSGKPLLVLANKQDKMDSLLQSDILEELSLEKLVNEYKSFCCIFPCSAALDFCKKTDQSIIKGLRWLLHTIALDYKTLCGRVLHDATERRFRGGLERSNRTWNEKEQKSKKESPQESRAQQVGQKPLRNVHFKQLQPIHNIAAQSEKKLKKKKKKKKTTKLKTKDSVINSGLIEEEEEERRWPGETRHTSTNGTLLPRNRVGGILKHNNKETKGSVRQQDTVCAEETQTADGFEKKKKKKKKVKNKNKINSQECAQNPDMSATFDLYRKAIMALKARQQGQVVK
nr:PREDICTED: ADP-ribosylation factor-like protein 13B [Latimeria chalumnae]|eukprot:XP_005992053.2 PREDICTED: ADP-ribosylation factor-like protein 13B [Latimeria chalumnae]